MSTRGPAYTGLWRERMAAAENIKQMLETIEIEIAESTVSLLTVRLEILDGYWLRFQKRKVASWWILHILMKFPAL